MFERTGESIIRAPRGATAVLEPQGRSSIGSKAQKQGLSHVFERQVAQQQAAPEPHFRAPGCSEVALERHLRAPCSSEACSSSDLER
jgi:hypothetical protein